MGKVPVPAFFEDYRKPFDHVEVCTLCANRAEALRRIVEELLHSIERHVMKAGGMRNRGLLDGCPWCDHDDRG